MEIDLDQALQQLANKILSRDKGAEITRTIPQVQNQDPFQETLFDIHVVLSDKSEYHYAVVHNVVTGQLDTLPIVEV